MEDDEGLQYGIQYTVYRYIMLYSYVLPTTFNCVYLRWVHVRTVPTVYTGTYQYIYSTVYTVYTGIYIYISTVRVYTVYTVPTSPIPYSTYSEYYTYIPYIIQYKNCTRRFYFQIIYGYEGNDRGRMKIFEILFYGQSKSRYEQQYSVCILQTVPGTVPYCRPFWRPLNSSVLQKFYLLNTSGL